MSEQPYPAGQRVICVGYPRCGHTGTCTGRSRVYEGELMQDIHGNAGICLRLVGVLIQEVEYDDGLVIHTPRKWLVPLEHPDVEVELPETVEGEL